MQFSLLVFSPLHCTKKVNINMFSSTAYRVSQTLYQLQLGAQCNTPFSISLIQVSVVSLPSAFLILFQNLLLFLDLKKCFTVLLEMGNFSSSHSHYCSYQDAEKDICIYLIFPLSSTSIYKKQA